MRKRIRNQHRRPVDCIEAPWAPAKALDVLEALGQAVYVIRARNGLVKIGYTTNLKQRLQNLGHDEILALWLGASLADEMALHRRLHGHAVVGREWYAIDDPDVIVVINELREPLGLELLPA